MDILLSLSLLLMKQVPTLSLCLKKYIKSLQMLSKTCCFLSNNLCYLFHCHVWCHFFNPPSYSWSISILPIKRDFLALFTLAWQRKRIEVELYRHKSVSLYLTTKSYWRVAFQSWVQNFCWWCSVKVPPLKMCLLFHAALNNITTIIGLNSLNEKQKLILFVLHSRAYSLEGRGVWKFPSTVWVCLHDLVCPFILLGVPQAWR